MDDLVEVVLHGRGGYGVVTAARLLAEAALLENKYIQAFPEFGPERTGAPVKSYVRISDGPIDVRSMIYSPHVILIIDSKLNLSLKDVEGLYEAGVVIANKKRPGEWAKMILDTRPNAKVFYVDALGIAQGIGDSRLQNSAVLGAFSKTSSIVSLEALKRVYRGAFAHRILDANLSALEQGYKEVRQA